MVHIMFPPVLDNSEVANYNNCKNILQLSTFITTKCIIKCKLIAAESALIVSVVQKPDFLLIPHSFQGDCIITSPKEPDKQLWDGPFTQGSKSPQTHKVQ